MDGSELVIISGDFPFDPGTRFIKPVPDIPGCFEVVLILGPAEEVEAGWTSVMVGDTIGAVQNSELLRLVANGTIQLIPTTLTINHIPECG